MRLAALMGGVALIALMAQPGLAQNQDTKQPQATPADQTQQLAQADMDFAKTAAADGMAEVELGKLAKEQGKTDPVQQFGQRMVDDHSQANDKLKSIAENKGIDLPTDPSDEAKKTYDDLKQKSGQEFDQAYMDTMVKDHHKAVDLFEQEAKSGKDTDLQSFAEAVLPTLKEHLDLAEQTQSQVMAGNDSGGAVTAPMPDKQAAADSKATEDTAAKPDQQASDQTQDMGAGATPPEGLKSTDQPMQTQDAGATPPADQQAASEPMPAAPSADQPADQQAAVEPMPAEPAADPSADQQAATAPMPSKPVADQPATDQQQAAAAPSGVPVLAKDVIGTDVVNSKGDAVGEIKDLVIDANQVQYAVVSVGGFLGIGDKEVVIPLDQLKLGEDQSYLMTAETVDQLKQMPEYDKDQFQPKG